MSIKVAKPTAQEVKSNPREFAIYTLLDKNKDSTFETQALQDAAKQYGSKSSTVKEGNLKYSQFVDLLVKAGEPCEGKGDCLSWAAQDDSGHLAPWKLTRRQPGPEDIFLQVVYCGVCHSDLHQLKNEWGNTTFPVVPGHEIAGIVCDMGKNVTGWKLGDKVGVGCFIDACRNCHACEIKDDNYCPGCVLTYNSKDKEGNPTYGGYSTHLIVDHRYCLRIPDNLQFDSVAPLLCAGITTYSPLMHYEMNKPGFKLGVVGLGGLGHMAVKFGKAMGLEVTVISTSDHKKQEALEVLKADHFLISKNEKEMQAHAKSLNGIIDTVSAVHEMVPLLGLLDLNGKIVCVGVPPEPMSIPAFPLLASRLSIGGSMIGGIRETQEMLDFCGKHNVVCKCEIIPMQYINTALERLVKNDVKYRFVIDVQNSCLL